MVASRVLEVPRFLDILNLLTSITQFACLRNSKF